VVDPNRDLDDPTAFPPTSDGISIPGNQGLGPVDRARRAASCRDPYHAEIATRLDAFAGRGVTPAMIAVHTCTPVFSDVVRQWHVGVMWDEDPRIAVPLLTALGRTEVCVGDNEPYSGRDPDDYTLDTHAERRGLPYVGIEVRQDLVDTDAGATHWAGVLAGALAPILADDALYRPFAPTT
jgi:predicted N-formylglutamate amidohydrolase